MHAKLPVLEKNILKYRALQMVLLLHQVESFRIFLIGSIRASDKLKDASKKQLPEGTKKPLERALTILVQKGVITEAESMDLQTIVLVRNKIGHTIHELVQDISAPEILRHRNSAYDYYALTRFEHYRDKITRAMTQHFILQAGVREISFEQAEAAYTEELVRLRKRIDKQYKVRCAAA